MTPDATEARLLREALSLRADAAPPRSITCCVTRTLASSPDPERAAAIARMVSRGWLRAVVRAACTPAAVRHLWVVTQGGLDALHEGNRS